MTQIWITAERNSASDEELVVVALVTSSGQQVKAGSVLFELEGAKSVFDVESPDEGYFYPYAEEGDRVDIGSAIGLISSEPLSKIPAAPDHSVRQGDGELKQPVPGVLAASDAARELAAELGVDLTEIKGYDFITANAVREFAGSKSSPAVSQAGSHSRSVRRVVVLGGGNGAIQLREAALTDSSLALVGVLDDRQNTLADFGVPSLGKLEEEVLIEIFRAGKTDGVAIAISSRMEIRSRWRMFCQQQGFPMISIIHKRAFIAASATIEPGALIMDSARVGAMAKVDSNVFISAGVDIEHHCIVGSDTTFGPGVFLSGGVKVGDRCQFGSLIAVEPGLQIGSDTIISSGAVLTTNIEANSIVKVASDLKIRSRVK
ncbi:MAG: hypothetical protein KF742_03760 [Cryobacterium sp.]|nr:hypothetical protein [Cryobacterium sp.]MCO5294621.1 hypothetical protein [Homoserinimonas sp.]